MPDQNFGDTSPYDYTFLSQLSSFFSIFCVTLSRNIVETNVMDLSDFAKKYVFD